MKRLIVIGIALIAAVAAALWLAAWARRTSSPAVAVASASPAGVNPSWWAAAQASIAAQEYEPSFADGVLQAPNRAHAFRVRFADDRVAIGPRTGSASWRWTWRTLSLGRGGESTAFTSVRPRAHGSRVEYERGDVVEWYENGPAGLEQGFTLKARPAGSASVRILGSIALEGLQGRAEPGAVVGGLEAGTDVLRYGGLRVVDATGRELPSRLSARGSEVELTFEDAGATYPVTVDPLVTSPSWTYDGLLANAEMGYCVATAGDVNGDGLSDIIVGTPTFTNAAGQPSGRVFVFIGRSSGPAAAADWYATPTGADGTGGFGTSVASAGDVNGDGYDDIAVGAPLTGNPNNDYEGSVFVWLGGPAGGLNGTSGLGPTGSLANADWLAWADQTQADFGRSVACAGDVNGDGYADLLTGSPGYHDDGAQINEGWVFLWPGSAGGLGPFLWSAQSNAAGALLGWSVSTAGDVNGDGYDDVVLGAPGGNAALLWLGGAGDLGADGTPFNADWSANGTQAGARLGQSVCTAGDVNGDGYADVAIGAPLYQDPDVEEGKVFVWLGGPGDLGNNGNPVNADWSMGGNSVGAHFGHCVAPAGDVDGDGFADLIVGAPMLTGDLATEGGAWAYRGSGSGLESSAFWSAQGNQAGAQYGASVATAGDVNGDGFADVLVGAPMRDGVALETGRAALYAGSARGPATSASWLQEGNQADAHFGFSVASAGDVNGDGYSDVLVGMPDYDGGQADEGRVYLFPGQPTGLSLNSSWSAEVDQAGAAFGFAVSSAGDLNGDGYADVAAGAPTYDGAAADAGACFVWFGSSTGPGANGTTGNADESLVESQASAAFGRSVAWAGDVNGDGFSDLAVGAPYYDHPALGEGQLAVYYGGLDGIQAGRSWWHWGSQAGCNFGASVAGAGDVNGDGYSDVIVGAPGFDNGQEDEGRAGVLLGGAAGLSHVLTGWDESDQAGAQFGASVAGAGDVNGDGYSDVVVGSPWWESVAGQANEGRAWVYLGSAGGLVAVPAWTAEADVAAARLGTSVASAGDVNGDGFSDLIAGAPGILGSRGSAYLWLGAATGLGAPGTPANADWTEDGNLGAIPGQFGTSVACAGDVDGDGFSDLIVGAPNFDGDLADEGRAFVYYGNSAHGMDRAAQQRRHDDADPVHALGFSSSESEFRLRALGRSPGGRAQVRLQYELRQAPAAWVPANTMNGTPWTDTGAPGTRGSMVDLNALVPAPAPGLFRWRVRVATRSPLFPHGPWVSPPENARNEGDIRFTDGVLAVEAPAPAARALRVAGAQPSRGPVRLAFELDGQSRITLEVFDVTGRRVRTLARSEAFGPGAHTLTWDGLTDGGASSPGGCYFARLVRDSRPHVARITRLE